MGPILKLRTGMSRWLVLGLALVAFPLLPRVVVSEETAPKVVRKGGVSLYPDERRIEVSGKFCLAEGPIELFACAAGGKEYESVISLDVVPEMLHFCMLLLKLKPGDTGPEFQGDPDNAPTGSPVTVKVRWLDQNGKEKTVPAEELCWNPVDRRTMEPTPWVFSGSRRVKDPETQKEVYWANVEKSVIVVYRDPSAVLDLPLASSANDESYIVNTAVVPRQGTACTVILEPAPEPPPPPKNAQGGAVLTVDVTFGGRVLFNGGQPANPVDAVKKLLEDSPKDTFRVAIDHGAPAESAALALETLDAAGARVESIETVRLKPDVKDAVIIVVGAEKVSVDGKETTADRAAEAVRTLPGREQGIGVGVKLENGSSLKAAGAACRALAEVEGIILRVICADGGGGR